MRYLFAVVIICGSLVNYSQALYDASNITSIDITFTQSNWDQLLDQYYSAGDEQRLEATVVVNGQTFSGAGVKYKGNSTYNASNAKNPLNIKLDYTFQQDYEGFTTLKLANGKMDPSWVREVLSYELLRQYMHAPQSNYAWVTINGVDYGLMVSSESINSEFIDSHFYSDNDNTLVKCNPASVSGGGGVLTGCIASNNCSLQYLGADSACYYNYYELQSDHGWGELRDLTNDVINDFPNNEIFLDRDRFIWMLAFNNVFVNLDSYTGPFVQNYYIFKDDYGISNPVVWDLNMSLGAFRNLTNGGGGGGGSTDAQLQQMDPFLRSTSTTWPMLNKVLSDARLRRMYVAHCRTMLEENFLNDWYSERALQLQDVVDAAVQQDPNDFYTYANFIANINSSVSTGGGGGMSSAIGLTTLMETRKTYMMSNSEFAASPPVINAIDTPENAAPGQTIAILADVTNASYVMLGWRKNQSEHFTHIQMMDDGLHNDGASGDGQYGMNVVLPMGGMQYFIYVENSGAGLFSPARAEHEFYCIGSTGGLVINEVQSNNSTTIADQAGDHSDWIELYNAGSGSLDLSSYYLSDEINNPGKFQLPSATIAPGEYYIVWCDEEQEEGENHANFKLPSEGGETITLSDLSFSPIDLVFIPSLVTDTTYGRYPNGDGPFKLLTATFAANNSEAAGIAEQEAVPFELYPNPANDVFYLRYELPWEGSVSVYDMLGQKVLLTPFAYHAARTSETIRIEPLAPGTYIVNCGGKSKMLAKS